MPFLLVTGLPSSGKTTIVNRISDFISQKDKKVVIIREEDCDDFFRAHYNDSKKVSILFFQPDCFYCFTNK